MILPLASGSAAIALLIRVMAAPMVTSAASTLVSTDPPLKEIVSASDPPGAA
jgi:hypothetical protein